MKMELLNLLWLQVISLNIWTFTQTGPNHLLTDFWVAFKVSPVEHFCTQYIAHHNVVLSLHEGNVN